MRDTTTNRRQFLRLVGSGSVIALAGCLGSDTESSENTDSSTDEAETGAGTQPDAKANGSVPERYETAKGLSGRRRDPAALTAKETVAYRNNPNGGQGCSGCQHFIPPKGDDEAGACVLVAGRIRSDAWCKLFSPTG